MIASRKQPRPQALWKQIENSRSGGAAERRRRFVSAMSGRRRAERGIYAERSAAFKREHPRCFLFPWLPATDCHHSRGRAGELYLDDRFYVSLSRRAHDLVRDQPDTARALGALCERGGWNAVPDEPTGFSERQWFYGLTRRGTVQELPPGEALAFIGRGAGVPVQLVLDTVGEGHILVGDASDTTARVGDDGTLTFTKGGPTGGYWLFRKDGNDNNRQVKGKI